MKKPYVVVVFGGSGFLGSRLIRYLAQKGWYVRLAERNPEKALPLKTAGDVGQIVPMYVNFKSERSITSALQGADLVINLVGSGVKSSFFKCRIWKQTSIAERIAKLAKKAGVKDMLYVSAALSSDCDARFARAKRAAEEAVLGYYPEALIVRPNTMFGREDHFLSFFARMMRALPFFFVLCGSSRITPVYVGDVAEGISHALDRSRHEGNICEFHGENIYSHKEVVDRLKAYVKPDMHICSLSNCASYVVSFFAGFIPFSPVCWDAVSLLKYDIVPGGCKTNEKEKTLTLNDVGVVNKVSLDAFLEQNASYYQVGGRFKKKYK